MSFITYSQNFEDLMLWRALKDVKEGFYIDVGANDPIKDSVTKAFYDNGWSGINIEPEYRFFKALKKDRLRDINLNCAVSSSCKEIPLYISKLRGWSTTSKEVSQHQEENSLLDEVVMIPAKSLDEIVKEYKDKIKNIHFLKVDVEGAEKDVLESFSFSIRPWIVMVEATAPGTNDDVSDAWEHILLQNDYILSYFDGVNKYYLAKEKSDLATVFLFPPNVVDDWIHIDHKHALESAQRLQIQLENEKKTTTQLTINLDNEITGSRKIISDLKNELTGLYSSKSWKITKPLRTLMSYLKQDKKEEELVIEKENKPEMKKQDNRPKLSKEANSVYKDLVCE